MFGGEPGEDLQPIRGTTRRPVVRPVRSMANAPFLSTEALSAAVYSSFRENVLSSLFNTDSVAVWETKIPDACDWLT